MKKYIVFLIAIIFAIHSCERDDICLEDTTPNLKIKFYNEEDTASLKTLKIKYIWAIGNDSIPEFEGQSLDSILLPLNLMENKTTYIIENDTGIDTLKFEYNRNDVFISRSCGYKVLFDDLNLNEFSKNWIKDIKINTTTIENENDTHIHIFH